MFSLFKKNAFAYPAESKWAVVNGQRAGKPMFLRRNESGGELAGHPEFKYRLGVAVPLLAPNVHGLPTNEEMEQLNAIEDELAEQLERNQQSLHVLAITTGGMREFVFYTREPTAAKEIVESLRDKTTSHELQSYIAEDPKWQLFKQFA